MRDFRKIKVYQKAESLVLVIYEITKNFPKAEIYGLTSQVRRAVVSIACNVAEGASRQHQKDYLHFLFIARASLAEVRCLTSLACKLNYLTEADGQSVESLLEEISKMLQGLIAAVKAETGE